MIKIATSLTRGAATLAAVVLCTLSLYRALENLVVPASARSDIFSISIGNSSVVACRPDYRPPHHHQPSMNGPTGCRRWRLRVVIDT